MSHNDFQAILSHCLFDQLVYDKTNVYRVTSVNPQDQSFYITDKNGWGHRVDESNYEDFEIRLSGEMQMVLEMISERLRNARIDI